MKETVDAVVVGAGYAGLAAARKLTDEGCSTVVLEARDRVGGRTHTVEEAGAKVDLGGQWIGPGQDHIYALAAETGVATFPQSTAGDDVVLEDGRPLRVTGDDGYDPGDLEEYGAALAALDRAAADIPLDRPWAAPEADTLDAMTLETWLDGQLERPGARTMLATTVANLFAAQPSSLSLLHVLFYVRSGGGWQSLANTEGGAQQDRLVGGLQEPAVRLAARLGDAVRLRWPVRTITQDSRGVAVTGEAGEVRADRAIVAIPPTLAGRLVYDPPLPAGRDQLTQRLPGGSVVKFNLVYPTPWWRELGQRGFVYSPDEPVSMMFDATPAEGEPGVIVGFMEGAKGVEAGRLAAAARRALVIEQAERALGPPSEQRIGYVDRDWSAEQWTRGCYGAHFPPGVWTQLGPSLREPVGRIHWAGTETADRWMGYVDGAIESGIRAAVEVLEDRSRASAGSSTRPRSLTAAAARHRSAPGSAPR
jgi:monoamine oxidase